MRTTTKQKAKPHPVFERTGENSIRISALPNRADAQRMNLKRSYHAFMRASRHLCGNKQSRAVGDVAAAPLRSFCVGHPRQLRWQRQPCENVSTYSLPFPWPPGASPAPGGLGLMAAIAAMQTANAALEHDYTFVRIYSCTFN